MVGLDGILILFIIIAVAILSAVILWLQGAAYSKSQELKDWDVTVADGLDELEKEEKES
jgi:cell division protein FtsL